MCSWYTRLFLADRNRSSCRLNFWKFILVFFGPFRKIPDIPVCDCFILNNTDLHLGTVWCRSLSGRVDPHRRLLHSEGQDWYSCVFAAASPARTEHYTLTTQSKKTNLHSLTETDTQKSSDHIDMINRPISPNPQWMASGVCEVWECYHKQWE